MENGPIWQSRKFWMVVVGVIGVMAVALGGAAVGLDEEARRKATEAILWLVGLLMGGHTVTDVGSQVAGAMRAKAEADSYRAMTERMGAGLAGDKPPAPATTPTPAPAEPPDMEPKAEADDEG